MSRSLRCSMSGSGVVGLGSRCERWAAAGCRRSLARLWHHAHDNRCGRGTGWWRRRFGAVPGVPGLSGRPPVSEREPGWGRLERLVDPATRGIPSHRCGGPRNRLGRWRRSFAPKGIRSRPGRWPSCCTSPATICTTRKTREGRDHPDRDAQFRYLSGQVRLCSMGIRWSRWTPRRRNSSAGTTRGPRMAAQG